MRLLLLQDKSYFQYDITLVLQQSFLQLHHVMSAVSVLDYMPPVMNINFQVYMTLKTKESAYLILMQERNGEHSFQVHVQLNMRVLFKLLLLC